MNDGRSAPRPRPLIRSATALRAIVAGITFTTFAGMSAFAATHIQNPLAPLEPTGNGVNTNATPAPTAPTTRSRSTFTGGIPTTTIAPRTRTARS